MCGFAGEVRFDATRADVDAVARMAERVAARGPDGRGSLIREGLAWIHHRLAIFDPTPRADQPMVDDARGLSLVYNGALYNHVSLRRELEAAGHRFTTTGDTEVVLAAFATWSDDAWPKLRGQFAVALHDARDGSLRLVRDPFGIKPLYFADLGGVVRFASTLPSLVAGGRIDTRLDPIALHHYLSLHGIVPAPRTLLRGVAKVAPGTVVRFDRDGRPRAHRYLIPGPPVPEPGAAAQLPAALRDAVHCRLAGDVDVGVLLSGGLDSSLLVALAAAQRDRPLTTFSIGFASTPELHGDEFAYADEVARLFATDHHRLYVTDDEIVSHLPDYVAAMSEPQVSHDAIAFWLLGRAVRGSHRVVLSGQGADEVFGGYHWYPRLAAMERTSVVAAYRRAFFDRSHAAVLDALAPDWCTDDATEAWLSDLVGGLPRSVDPASAAMWIDATQMLAGDPLARVDAMMMASAVEVRVPFVDPALWDVARRIPLADKLASGGKGVLKSFARTMLPAWIVDRPKAYFPVPPLMRLTDGVRDWLADALGRTRARSRGLWRPGRVDDWLASPHAETSTMGVPIVWQVGLLEAWLATVGA